jgi:hypothetical protein
MDDSVVTYTINVNPGRADITSLNVNTIERTMYDMKNLIIENVGFMMAKRQEKALVNNLERNMVKIVTQELSRMARQISQMAVGIADRANLRRGGYTPQGSLSVTGAISRAMQGRVSPVTLGSGTGMWPARNPNYLKQRRKAGTGTRWFKQTGALQKYLARPDTYTTAYGPVKVAFIKAKSVAYYPKRIHMSTIGTGVPGVKAAHQFTVGRVEISVLSRISEDMLSDPGSHQPSAWHTGLFGYLDEKAEKKLLNREDFYRPFLEHFLSFYLTRAIPNAIFRKMEEVASGALSSQATLK